MSRRLFLHNPALDGIRGIALIGVLLFHSSFAWMSGGFLGVSTFFTLSGYLITRLLLDEHGRTGWISLGAFWERRLRRLVPALTLGIVGVLATSSLWVPLTARELLPGDAIASFFYYSNWRFMDEDYAYSRLFADPSPLQHYWSLSIEGQFYLVYPLLLGALFAITKRLRIILWLLLGLVACSAVLASATDDFAEASYRIYYGTGARSGELLMGACLAVLLASRSTGLGLRSATTARNVVGGVVLVVMIVLWTQTEVESPWLYRGGFAGYAILSAALLWSVLEPATLVYRALASGPLTYLGRISYGAYVYHWPLFLVLGEEATGLGPIALFVVRMVATIGLAALSYRFVEEPIRRGRALTPGWEAVAGLAAACLVLLLAGAVESRLPGASVAEPPAVAQIEQDGRVFRVGVFGDSTAGSLVPGLRSWLRQNTSGRLSRLEVKGGCGLSDRGEYETQDRWRKRLMRKCAGFPGTWTSAVEKNRLDLAVVLVGPHEVMNRRFEPDGPSMTLGDPAVDDHVRQGVRDGIEALRRGGAEVVWLTSPKIRLRLQPNPNSRSEREASDPARMDRLNEIVREVADSQQAGVRVVDLASYVRDWPGGELDPELRPDGVHFSVDGIHRLTAEWLGPAILEAYRDMEKTDSR